MAMNPAFWKGRSIFVTGHTGFKGGWLSLWLSQMGAKAHGYALQPQTRPNFFSVTHLEAWIESSTIGDIRDLDRVSAAMRAAEPSIVIHMAAQPLVKESYQTPVETFATNLMGTVNVLEAARNTPSIKAIVNVTTDKCYEIRQPSRPFCESDRLGGYDTYSSSKACAELASAAYRKSFLSAAGKQLATARAGNVIGGGDWSSDRLLPDFLRALDRGEPLQIRSPQAIRPWQHVLDPLCGYLTLAEHLLNQGENFAEAWNFGPEEVDAKSVFWIIDHLCQKLPDALWELDMACHPQETQVLKLDSLKAKKKLNWKPRWPLETALNQTVAWHLAWRENQSMADFSVKQIASYLE